MIAPRLWGVKERAGAAPSAHRDKHTPGTAKQAAGPRTKPTRKKGWRKLRFAQTSAAEGKRPARERSVSIRRRSVREMGAGSACRSRRQATCARAFSLDPQEVRSRNGCGIMPPLEQDWRKLRFAQASAAEGKRPARERSASTRRRCVRESGAASCRRLNKAGENFDLHKRAQPKASNLRESVQLRPAGSAFAKWARHHAALGLIFFIE